LDVTVQAQILDLLCELRDGMGTAILLITHDLGVVNEVADRVAVMYAGKVVERGTRLEILHAPRHPYTRGLLRSMPGNVAPGERLCEIPGVVPAAGEWPQGCRFSTRCAEALSCCADEPPPHVSLGQTHAAECHRVAREEAE
jgi:oligopeptide/dipeptide ABC transporter ATP-binding protein